METKAKMVLLFLCLAFIAGWVMGNVFATVPGLDVTVVSLVGSGIVAVALFIGIAIDIFHVE